MSEEEGEGSPAASDPPPPVEEEEEGETAVPTIQITTVPAAIPKFSAARRRQRRREIEQQQLKAARRKSLFVRLFTRKGSSRRGRRRATSLLAVSQGSRGRSFRSSLISRGGGGFVIPRRADGGVDKEEIPACLRLVGSSIPTEQKGYILHAKAMANEAAALDALLTAGADPNMLDAWNRTALHYACLQGHVEATKVLLRRRETKTDIFDSFGFLPLHIAAKLSFRGCVNELLAFGRADPHRRATGVFEDESEEDHGVSMQSSVASFRAAIPRTDVPNTGGKLTSYEIGMSSTQVRNAFIEYQMVAEAFICILQEGGDQTDVESLASLIVTKNAGVNVPNNEGTVALDLAMQIPGRPDLIQFLMDYHAKVHSDYLDDSEPEYEDVVKRGLLRYKREQVLTELVSSEKVYTDDLDILFRLFNNETEIRRHISRKGAEAEAQEIALSVFTSLQRIRVCHTAYVESLRQVSNMTLSGEEFINEQNKWIDGLAAIQALLENVKEEPYLEYCRKYNILESAMKSDPAFSSLYQHFVEMAKQIPYPKVQLFASAFSRPRVRLIKYKDLFARIGKYCDADEDHDLQQAASDAMAYVDGLLQKMDAIIGEVIDESKKDRIARLWKKKYRVNPSYLHKQPDKILLCHSEEVACWNLNAPPTARKIRIVAPRDVFIWDDAMYFGDVEEKVILGIYFHDTKSVFYFSEDSFRVSVYKNDEKIVDLQFMFRLSRLWARTIEEYFFSAQRRDLFANRIHIVKRFAERSGVDQFLQRPSQVDAAAMTMQRLQDCEKQMKAQREALDMLETRHAELAQRMVDIRRSTVDSETSELPHPEGHDSPVVLDSRTK